MDENYDLPQNEYSYPLNHAYIHNQRKKTRVTRCNHPLENCYIIKKNKPTKFEYADLYCTRCGGVDGAFVKVLPHPDVSRRRQYNERIISDIYRNSVTETDKRFLTECCERNFDLSIVDSKILRMLYDIYVREVTERRVFTNS